MLAKVAFSQIKRNQSISFAKKYARTNSSGSSEDSFKSYDTNKNIPAQTLFHELRKNLSPKTINYKLNEVLLEKLFSSAEGVYKFHQIDTKSVKEFIKILAKLDFNNISQKYLYLTEEVSKHRRIIPTFIKNILTTENVTAETLASLYSLSQAANSYRGGGGYVYHLEMMVYYLNHYNDFDTLSTRNQYDYIDKLEYYFDAENISNLDDNDDLFRFDLVKDIKKMGSITAMKEHLIERAKNSPVSSVKVDENLTKRFIEEDIFSYENLKESIGKTNLDKYRKGLPLKYKREQFIADFKEEIRNLNPEERKQVFEYFEFSIDEDDDIIRFPVLNNSSISDYPKKVKNAIISAKKLVEDFILNNKIELDEKGKKAENILNEFIKVFPEFISVIGKIQHSRKSVDFHTLDVLKMCLNDSRTEELSKKEQRILFLSVMFHDIAKKQGVIDRGHQRPSAYYAKEIIKKIPISAEEKERIYNIILNSHWTTDNNSIYDIALNFRFNNDFKIAKILACADGTSSGFSFPIEEGQLQDIQSLINKINSTGIPLFADNLPKDKSKFPINNEGIRYIDFTDEEADLSQYGFKKGTTVKDLNFLCHNTANSIGEISDLCDDSKDICLSAEYKNASNKGIVTKYNARYSGNCHIIIHNVNENIAAGGKDVTCTGGKKGYREFKNYIFTNYFQKPNDNFQKKLITKRRTEIPNSIKEIMELSNEEYSEFFSQINQYDSKDDIQDIAFSSGRILKREDIINCISELQNTLINNKSEEFYINEIVMFRPKLEAIVMEKPNFFKTPIEKSEIKQVALKNNIPIILV